MREYLKLMRVKHYLKNFLIFVPLIFSSNLFNFERLSSSIFAFLAFCCLSSIIYIINDIYDVESDRKHEVKKHRPIASGKISTKSASILMGILFVLMCVLNLISTHFKFDIYIWVLLCIYLVTNILYSGFFKNKPIVDIAILVLGFVIRILYGAVVINVEVSNWLYLTVLAMAMYLVLGKRRNEIIKNGSKSRSVLKYYTREFLDKNMYMFLGLTIVFYSLWCIDINNLERFNNLLIWTIPLVIMILMKYSLNIDGDTYGDPVDVVLSDKILIGLILLYVFVMIIVIYLIGNGWGIFN